MIKKKTEIGAIFAAILLVSIAFVPAVMAQPTNPSTNGSNGKTKAESAVGVAGETACDILTSALWALSQYVSDSRISQAENLCSQGANAFRNNNLITGYNDLLKAVKIAIALATYWAPHLASWLYTQLINAINYVKNFLHQHGYW
jgi:hypothetical protein